MNDSELPEAAMRAGAEILCDERVEVAYRTGAVDFIDASYEGCEWMARAVLVAATERIECPDCNGHGMDYAPRIVGGFPESCSVCAGSGFLFVLKTEKP